MKAKLTHRFELLEEFHGAEGVRGIRHEDDNDEDGTHRALDHADGRTVHPRGRPSDECQCLVLVCYSEAMATGYGDWAVDDVKRQFVRACKPTRKHARQSTGDVRAHTFKRLQKSTRQS